jgi:hypothetical protein
MRKLALIAAAAVLAVACEDSPTAPDLSEPSELLDELGGDAQFAWHATPVVRVLNRNLFVGADVASIFAAQTPEEIPFEVAALWARIAATDFPARAELLADEVLLTRPHLIGLQEVSLFRVQTPGDFLVGNPQEATTVALSFLQVFLDALAARGLDYVVADSIPNIDVEVPIVDPGSATGLSDIRLTDYDVILAAADVDISNLGLAANYSTNFSVALGGLSVELTRGFTAVDARITGHTYRFVNTHLEPTDPVPGQYIPDFQVAQTLELLGVLADVSVRTILVGDFSTDELGGTSPASQIVMDAGFVDLWDAHPHKATGVTCCQPAHLLNPVTELDRRVDIAYYRDAFTAEKGRLDGFTRSVVVGDDETLRTPSGLWPSDHAGVATALLIPGVRRQ